jgi:hypothetical protein
MDVRAVGEVARAQMRAGEWDAAEATCREILAVDPAHRAARYALSTLLLAKGDYAEAWPLYDARLELPETGIAPPRPSYPLWDGRPVESLMVWGEQGFGDQIMFARYLPGLAARGIRATFICSPGLVRPFQGLAPAVLGKTGELSVPRHDAWCMLGSLPRWLGGLPEAPYLRGEASRTGGVGVVWRGNAAPDPERSLSEALGAELLALPGAVSLQPEDTGARDFQDTADLMAGLDRVITIDTAAAHLAGALGKPVWILLPPRADWRWGRTGERTAWYPSATLIRRAEGTGSTDVVRDVKARLAAGA